ncbi:FliH/SctL family protein [Clostridium carnis]
MQLSYNLIKNVSAKDGNNKKIDTIYISKIKEDNKEKTAEILALEDMKKSYENIGEGIIKRAKMEAEKILIEARTTAANIEKDAYEQGYNQGQKNGYEDGYNSGYKNGYENITRETEEKVTKDIEEAHNILKNANEDYLKYIEEKQKEIIILALEMAKIIAGQKICCDEGIISLVEPLVEEAKGEENIVIRCNKTHIEAIKAKSDYYKKAYNIKGEIFLIEDPLMKSGNAVVERKTGKTIVGMDITLEKLEEELFR